MTLKEPTGAVELAPSLDSGAPGITSTRPPRWLPRALAMTIAATFAGVFIWHAFASLRGLAVNILISFFIALALEPMTVWLVRRGWKRGAAAGTVLGSSLAVAIGLFISFGGLFYTQLAALIQAVPALYSNIRGWVVGQFDIDLPSSDALINSAVSHYGTDVASRAIGIGTSALGFLFSSFTIGLITFYLMAAGPRFRAELCRWLTPNRQSEVLQLWEITQVKVSDFISSRFVLAALCSFFTFIFLSIIDTPYSLPLALFCGVVSQFVPTIGTYVGGALPCVVALTAQGVRPAVFTLVFIIVYQQVENLYFGPKVSAKALEMNPAVSFVVVLGFGAVFGPLGAFLGLPVAATIQAIANTYIQRHELVESDMLHDPEAAPATPSDHTHHDTHRAGHRLGRRRTDTSQDTPPQTPKQ